MKKLLILAGAVLFLAGACNSQPQATNPPPPATPSSKVDAAVNAYMQNIDSEEAVQAKSDTDIVNSDQGIINSYNGVSNASTY